MSLKDDMGWICDGCGGRLLKDHTLTFKYCPICSTSTHLKQPERLNEKTSEEDATV